MIPLLTASQIRDADAYTINQESVSSIDLMERAAKAFVGWFINHFPDKKNSISVYCGTGNNGGDGLAIARLLQQYHYKNINIKIAWFSDKSSDDFNKNLEKLIGGDIIIKDIAKNEKPPIEDSSILIDALLGTGLNKPLSEDYERLVKYLNSLKKNVVAVDVPTGFFTEGKNYTDATIFKAELVITFQQPKMNFLLPESAPYINCWEAVNIGLDEKFIKSLNSPYQLVEEKDIRDKLIPRHHFSNKGTFGHAMIIAGQRETMGAALLCSSACAHTGAGLTTACVPESGLTALNNYQAEVMAVIRKENNIPKIDWGKYSSVAVGPGLGKNEDALALLTDLLKNYKKTIVIDADGLNLLAANKHLWEYIPSGSILTPHVKEFDRLFGDHTNWWQRLQTLIEKTNEHQVYIILKNDYSITATPKGKLFFNSTSNAAMASGGMGDVLTGIIVALVAQKYSAEDACIIGNFIHGKAGDELALPNRMAVVLPGKLIMQLPITLAKLLA